MDTESHESLFIGRNFLAVAMAGLLAGLMIFQPALAQQAPHPAGVAERPNQVRGDEITPAQRDSVEKGLQWLAKKQAGDGSYTTGMQGYSNHAGITALAGLAFMQAGNLPGRGSLWPRSAALPGVCAEQLPGERVDRLGREPGADVRSWVCHAVPG